MLTRQVKQNIGADTQMHTSLSGRPLHAHTHFHTKGTEIDFAFGG